MSVGTVFGLYYGYMTAKNQKPLNPQIVLGVGAHPDDLDFGAAGTIAKWASEGATVYYLILTDGSKGSADKKVLSGNLIKIRQEEQRKAAEILGISDVFFLEYEDGLLEVSFELKKEIIRYIRQLKPDTVITMDPSMFYFVERGFINHPDHRAAGQATLDAVFPLARDHLAFPELLTEGLEPHKVTTLLMTNFEKQNHYVDVTDTLEHKMQALAAHKSQISNLSEVQKMMKDIAAENGKKAGHKHSEAFVRLDIP